jgi:hypothetical protein
LMLTKKNFNAQWLQKMISYFNRLRVQWKHHPSNFCDPLHKTPSTSHTIFRQINYRIH